MTLRHSKRPKLPSRLWPATLTDHAPPDALGNVRPECIVVQHDLYGFDFGFRRRELNTLSYCSALSTG